MISQQVQKKERSHIKSADSREWEGRAVVLASGTLLNQVDLAHEAHETAISAGVLRYCPICDGYEHTNHRMA